MGTTQQAILGRTREVEAIEGFVGRLPSEGGSLLISGEAGIGKSTLWRAGIAEAERRSQRVCRCRPAQAETEMSFAALIDIFDDVPEECFESLPGPQRRALDIALLRRESEGRRVDHGAVAAAAVRLFKILAEHSAVLVAVDDAQWLDPASAQVLRFAFRRLRDAPIGVLLSVRIGSGEPVADRLFESAPTELIVGPLSLGAVQRLLSGRLDSRLTRPLVRRIHQASGGNPFFALEIARGLQRRSASPRPDEALPIPDTLADVVREHLAGLGPDAGAVLLLASACPRPTRSLLHAAVGDGANEAVDRALAMDVIDLGGNAIEFTHPLLASILYADASPAERRDAHARLALVVGEPEERARHLGLAAEGPDTGVAASLDAAARIARARGAPSAAAELALLARALTPPDQVPEATHRVMDAADHHFAAGNVAAARVLLEELVTSLAAGPARARALHRLATVAYNLSGYDDAVRILEQALEEAGDDLSMEGRAHETLAWVKVQQGDVDVAGASRHARDALTLAERAGDEEGLVGALTVVIFTRFLLGEGFDETLMARALALEDRADHLPAERRPSPLAGLLMLWDDRAREGHDLLRRVLDRYVEAGDEAAQPVVLFYLAHAEWYLGLWDDACEHLEAACDVSEDMGFDSLLAFALAVQATIVAARGDIEDARLLVTRSSGLADTTANPMALAYSVCAAGEIELSVGDYAATHAGLGAMAAMLGSMPAEVGLIARVCGDEAEALVALGELDAAEEVVAAMERKAQAVDRPSLAAVAGRCRGLLAAARGDSHTALAAVERALVAHAQADRPFQRARTLLAQGAISRRARRKQPARAALEEALVVFEQLGAMPWAEKARTELARVGGRAPATPGLTATEAEVVDVVARGLSNKQVAAELFMSVNTVEAHLKHIFRKLGVRSRTELAARRISLPD